MRYFAPRNRKLLPASHFSLDHFEDFGNDWPCCRTRQPAYLMIETDTTEPSLPSDLEFWVNGRRRVVSNPNPRTTLAGYLRASGLVGTKIGCAQGGCGACSVILTLKTTDGLDHRPINSCLRPLVSCDGCAVTTVEGLGNTVEGLDPLQDQMIRHNGSQCGFCTPGFVTTARALLARTPGISRRQIEESFGGNLCRCTGYRGILHAVRQFASDRSESDAPFVCGGSPHFPVREVPVIPGESLLGEEFAVPCSKMFRSGEEYWYRPVTLDEAVDLRRRFSGGKSHYVNGCTAFGILPIGRAGVAIDLSAVSGLKRCEVLADRLVVGGGVTIEDLLDSARHLIETLPEHSARGMVELVHHGQQIAGLQVRCMATVGGNLAASKRQADSPHALVSDLSTILDCLGAQVEVLSDSFSGGRAVFPVNDLPRGNLLPDDALIASVSIPFTAEDGFVVTGRVARKRQMSHPIVNAGISLRVNAQGHVSDHSVRVVVGGLAGDAVRLTALEKALEGCDLSGLPDSVPQILHSLEGVALATHGLADEGLSDEVRRRLVSGLLGKLLLRLSASASPGLCGPDASGEGSTRPLATGTYRFDEDPTLPPLTRPYPKVEGFGQAAGEVRYSYDTQVGEGGLHAAVVLSEHAHADFRFEPAPDQLSVELRERFPGFECLITAADITSETRIGAVSDEPVFYADRAPHFGARLGLVVAQSNELAREIADHIRQNCLRYRPLPAVITLEEAINRGDLLDAEEPVPLEAVRPGTDLDLLNGRTEPSPDLHVLDGTMCTGAQAHFALEIRSAVATPGKNGEMHVVSATQWPNGDQAHVAHALGVPLNHVTVQVNQLGGGFGGAHHGSAQFSVMAALAARRTQRPVRVETTREENMLLIGKRHPFKGTYRAWYRDDGTIVGMDVLFESNGGCTTDASWQILGLAINQGDHTYAIPHFRIRGKAYRSNVTTNTAFRTFGTVQSHLIIESVIDHVAHTLASRGIPLTPEEIRQRNFYPSSDSIEDSASNHLGQPLGRVRIRENYQKLLEESCYHQRVSEATAFNRSHKWKKRGLAALPLKYGLGLKHIPSINNGAAIVSINSPDGSVTIVSGGIEMGQGITQKIVQLAAAELRISPARIRVAQASTDAIVNSTATAASAGFDVYGGAVAKACRTLRERLIPIWAPNSANATQLSNWEDDWEKLISTAYSAGVVLSVSATFHMPKHHPLEKGEPMGPDNFSYFTCGYSASEVELDVLTGEYTVLRSDVYFDLGRSASPAADFGQIEGGFVQGMGLGTCEEVRFSGDGRLITDNIWSYELPCTKSIPVEFHAALITTPPDVLAQLQERNQIAVAGSRAIGEPSLIAGNSVFFALRRALIAAREESGETAWPGLDAPGSGTHIVKLIPLPQ